MGHKRNQRGLPALLTGTLLALYSTGCQTAEQRQLDSQQNSSISSIQSNLSQIDEQLLQLKQQTEQNRQTLTAVAESGDQSRYDQMMQTMNQEYEQRNRITGEMRTEYTQMVALNERIKTVYNNLLEAFGDSEKRTGWYADFDRRDQALQSLQQGIQAINAARNADIARQERSLEIFLDFYQGPVGENGQRRGGVKQQLTTITNVLSTAYSSTHQRELSNYLTMLESIDRDINRLYTLRSLRRLEAEK